MLSGGSHGDPGDLEAGATGHAPGRSHLPPVRVRDLPDDVQSQSRPVVGGREAALEYPVGIVGREAGTVVRDVEAGFVFEFANGDSDVGAGVIDRVTENVLQ